MEKTISQIQKEVMIETTIWKAFSPLSMVATMIKECGEVARVINHLYKDEKKKDGKKNLFL